MLNYYFSDTAMAVFAVEAVEYNPWWLTFDPAAHCQCPPDRKVAVVSAKDDCHLELVCFISDTTCI